jgi:Tol biopolymer transport system component
MRRRISLAVCALALSACVDDAAAPRNDTPQFNHTTPPAPPAEIAVNNYTASFQESGLETFYKGDMALFNGGLSYGNSASTVQFVNLSKGYFDVAQTGLPVEIHQPGINGADHYSSTVMTEQPDQSFGLKDGLGIVTVRETFAYSSAPDDDYLIVKYSLTNTTSSTISNLYVGYMSDPDVHDYTINLANEYQLNISSYDAPTQSARVRLAASGSVVHHGIISLSHPVGTYRAWGNSTGPTFPDRDPADNAGWFSLLSGGVFSSAFGPGDIRQYVGTGATNLAPGETKVYTFALLGGESAADLTANINAARAKAGAFVNPVPALAATVNIQPGTSVYTARITFANATQASQFNTAKTRCGGAPITSAAVNGNYVDVLFNALALDSRRRSGAPMHCGGMLTSGTYFAGTDYPVFTDNAIPVTRLTNNAAADHGATWSPDASRLAFASARNGGGVFIMDPAVGEASVTQLVAAPGAQQVSWSTTGNIAFSRLNGIYVVPETGGTPVLLNNNGTDPRFSPDGSRIAFRRGSNLMLMNADGSNLQQLASATSLYPEWLDNNTVIFTRIVGVAESVVRMTVGLPSTETALTPPEPGLFRFSAMSPDGKTLAFTIGGSIVFQDMQSGLHTVALLNPSVAVSTVAGFANVAYSVDGKRVLFVSAGSNPDLYVIELPQPTTPAERVDQLQGSLSSLIADGLVSAADGAQLVDKLATVEAMVASGQLNPAINHVSAFINKVNALVNSRRLSQISGTQLTSEANDLIAQLTALSN